MKHSPLRKLELPLGYRLLALLVMVVPTCLFTLWFGLQFSKRVNQHRHRAATIVSGELTRTLKRPVEIGTLDVPWDIVFQTAIQGTVPRSGFVLLVRDVRIGTLPSEESRHGSQTLASVPYAQLKVTRLRPLQMTVILRQPTLILARRKDGQFFIADLFKTKPQKVDDKSIPLDVRVNVQDASVSLRDFSITDGRSSPRVTELIHVNGSVDTGGLLATRGQFSGEARDRSKTGYVVGRDIGIGLVIDHPVVGREQSTRVHVTSKDLLINYWVPLANLPKKDVSINGGRGTADINIISTGRKVVLSGDLRVTGTNLLLPKTKIPELSNVVASVYIRDQVVAFAGKAVVSGLLVRANGSFDLRAGTSGALVLTANRCTTRKAAAALSIPTARVKGMELGDVTLKHTLIAWNGPKFTADAVVTLKGIKIPNLKVAVDLDARIAMTAKAANLSGMVSAGRLKIPVKADIQLPTGSTRFTYHATSVALTDVLDIIKGDVKSQDFDVTADVSGTGHFQPEKKNGLATRAIITGEALAVSTRSEGTFEAEVDVDANRVKILAANILGAGGMATASGSLTFSGPIALTGAFTGMDLATSGLIVGVPFDDGAASGQVVIEGSLTRPVLNIKDLVVLHPRVIAENRVLQADALRCEEIRWISDTSGSLSIDLLKPLYVSWLPADVVVLGRIRGRTDLPQFDVTVSGKHVDIARLVPMIRGDLMPWALDILRGNKAYQDVSKAFGWRESDWDVSGDVGDLSARISGTTDQLRIAGYLELEGIGLGDYRIGNASTQFLWQNQMLTMTNVTATLEAGRVTGDIGITNDGTLSGVMVSDNLNLGILANSVTKDAAFGGSVAARVGLSGSIQRPAMQGQIVVREEIQYGASRWNPTKPFGVNATRVSDAEGILGWKVALSPLGTADYGANWMLSRLEWIGAEQTLQIDAKVDSLDIDDLRTLGKVLPVTEFTPAGWTDRIPTNLSGEIATEAKMILHLDGQRWVDPVIAVTMTGINPALGQAKFDRLHLNAKLSDRVWTIADASLDSDKSVITGRGTLRLPEESTDKSYGMDLVFESIQPSMDLFKPFVGDIPLVGQWDNITIVAKGTTERPKIQGTIDGTGLAWKTPSKDVIKLDVVRMNARLEATSTGDLYFFIEEAFAKHDDQEIRLLAGVPVVLETMRILPDKPIDSLKIVASKVDLKTLADVLQWKSVDVTGELNGEVMVNGTLNKPMLKGNIALTNVGAALASNISKRQMLSTLESGNLALTLSGNRATVTNGELFLAPPPSQPKLSGGSAAIKGFIQLDNLEDFTRLFQRADVNQPVARLRGQYALQITAEALRPEINNLTSWLEVKDLKNVNGLGEALSAQVDGVVNVSGDLLEPIFSTAVNQPLQVRDAIFRVPRPSNLVTNPKGMTINPQLRLGMTLATDARAILFASTTTGLELRGRGDVTVGGSITDTTVVANLITTGGQLRYPLARLDVNRGGDVLVNWSKLKSSATLSGVVAEGRITGIADNNITRAVDSRFANPVLANTGASTSQTYRVLAKLTGVVDIGAVGGTEVLQLLTLDAEPTLTRNQIVDLLGARRQFDLIASGNTDQAVREFGNRIFETGLVPSVFAPLTNSVRSTLRLDALDVTYGTDGLATFRVVRRFDEPFDRFSVDLTRSLSTRSQAGRQLPYSYGVNYELFTFRTPGRYQPRFLLGAAQTSTQRDTLFFIRGTVNY